MKRSKHNLSHTRLLTGDMGELLPVGLVEVLPGDSIQHATSMLVRATPLATPAMHPVNVRVHHWFVPFRLIWTDFESFITGGPDGLDASVYPTHTFTNPAEGTLADYLGVPSGTYSPVVSALPFRAYALVFNEWYRDQDLVTALTISKASGADTTTSVALQNVSWEKDYFTTARPWEQKGPSVTLPLGSVAPVKTGTTSMMTGAQTALRLRRADTGGFPGTAQTLAVDAAAGNGALYNNTTAGGAKNQDMYPENLYADLTSATAVDVNTVREAFALQRFEEARARYGSRYTEYLRYLGVRSSDARLQRPEYLGGGKQSLQFSEVLQTAMTTSGGATGVANLFGHGISAMRSNRYRRFFEEHGYVLSLAYVLPKTMYPQGLNRLWNRRVKEDFWQRELEHIGQQTILNKELYALHSSPDGTFGFQDRYDEYRRQESSVHGQFRSTDNDWHFARIFGSDPTLNSSFVVSNPAKRCFQDQSSDVLLMLAHHQLVARRMVARMGSSFIS